MIDTEEFINLEKDIDNISKAIDSLSKAINGVYNDLPKYLRTEILYPKKKPRGSIRRARNGVKVNERKTESKEVQEDCRKI